MAKLKMLVAFGAGYVLGSRAGRERYEQIVDKAQGVWHDPRVQRTASHAQGAVQEKASQAGSAVRDRLPGGDGTSAPGGTPTSAGH